MTDAAARGEFALDTISWVTPRLAVTDMHGAARVFGDANFYIINTAAEIATACDCKLPVDPINGANEVRQALDTLADLIHKQLAITDRKVVLHCQVGIERSVLACVWYLCTYENMSIDDAYQMVWKTRPVAKDRWDWVNG